MLENTSPERRAVDARPKKIRSAVSNGRRLAPGLDGRGALPRRIRDLQIGLRDELGRAPSVAETALIAQAATLIARREQLLSALGRGEPIDDEQLTRMSNVIARTLMAAGLTDGRGGGRKRQRRDGRSDGPSLAEYVASRQAAKLAAEPAE